MNQLFPSRKNYLPVLLRSFVAVVVLSLVSMAGYSQNVIRFTLLQQPCNNDGILVACDTSSLAVPPLTFQWRVGGQTVTHTVNSTCDTLYNYSGAPGYVNAYNATPPGGGQFYGYYQGSPPFTFTDTITNAMCPQQASVKVTIKTGGTPPFTYQWMDMSNNIVGVGNPVSLPGGQYNVKITDGAGCVASTENNNVSGTSNPSIYIDNLTPVTFTLGTTPANCTNGTATVTNPAGGIAPYSYLWTNGATTSSITGLGAGQYRVTVTDAQGCYLTKFATIQQSVTVVANTTVTNATCLQNDGSILVFGSGGQGPYSYVWSNGQQSQTAVGLVAGYYTVTVKDANNCTGQKGVSVTAATPITATYTTTPSQCTTGTGTATLNITGGTPPLTVLWATFPAQTGTTATGLKAGNYSFRIVDAVGCVRNGTVVVPAVSVVTASVYKANATCLQTNGAAGVNVITGSSPYAYLWSNGATGASISAVAAGYYSVVITDNLGCTLTKSVHVEASSPINIGLNSTPATCIFNSDGSITANPSGGTGPYAFNWSNGQTTQTATGLASGHYRVTVQDNTGCTKNIWTDLGFNASNNSCYCTLTGKVYEDLNQDCNLDNGETGIENIQIHVPGRGYAYTNASGTYLMKVPTGNYTLSESVQSYYPLAPCQNNTIAVAATASSGCIITNNFANIINPIHDVRIITCKINEVVPGFTHHQKVVVENKGTIAEPGIQMGYEHDGQLMFSRVVPNIFTQQDAANFPDWYSITGGFPSLAPAAKQTFNIDYQVPVNIPLGTSVWFKDTVSHVAPVSDWLLDYSPWNNVNQYYQTVVGSFDPNDKGVYPAGSGAQGYITTSDSVLNYTVRFQNTGTYMAQRVVVIDTLDSDLDFASLVPGYSTHSYVPTLSEDGVITFTFNNINLPDSFSQPIASNGMVMYTVKQKPGLSGGTQMKSPASIYFDFNAPVVTNTPINTIDFETAIKAPKTDVLDMTLFPNPTSGSVSLLINATKADKNATIRVYNLIGDLIYSRPMNLELERNMTQLDLGTLSNGFYFVEISAAGSSQSQKLSVIR